MTTGATRATSTHTRPSRRDPGEQSRDTDEADKDVCEPADSSHRAMCVARDVRRQSPRVPAVFPAREDGPQHHFAADDSRQSAPRARGRPGGRRSCPWRSCVSSPRARTGRDATDDGGLSSRQLPAREDGPVTSLVEMAIRGSAPRARGRAQAPGALRSLLTRAAGGGHVSGTPPTRGTAVSGPQRAPEAPSSQRTGALPFGCIARVRSGEGIGAGEDARRDAEDAG